MGATFVDTALTVQERMLCQRAIANVLLAMGEWLCGTDPFDHAQVLLNIISKGRTTSGIAWVMQGIQHLHRSGVPAKSDMFSSRGIAGTEETDNRGLADLLLFKKECLGFVLGRLPFKLGFSEGCWLRLARVHLADYASHNLVP